MSDIDTAAADSLKVLDPKWPIREERTYYVGLDIEPSFQQHWKQFAGPNIRFLVQDVPTFDDFTELSMATSIFTLQFLPERHRRQVCRKVFEGLNSRWRPHRRRKNLCQDAEDARHDDFSVPELQTPAFFR